MDKTEKSYHKLIVWQRLRELLVLTYKLTGKLPRSEEFGLISQMRRAVVSVISNLVEGYLKRSKKDKNRFMEIAETSLLELEAQSEICSILGYWSEKEYMDFDKKRSECSYLLYRYKLKLE
ncbi:MAG: four helix bundle protein [Patescibacteria group bacterium]